MTNISSNSVLFNDLTWKDQLQEKMEAKSICRKAHCLILAYPAQGHINPILQFAKRLQHQGIKITLVTTRFFWSRIKNLSSSISLETISDGFDNGETKWSDEGYFDRFWKVGAQTLAELIEKLSLSGNCVDCIVYDSLLPWPLDVAKRFGLVSAVFLTQTLAVNSFYYLVKKGKLHAPLLEDRICIPGLPDFAPEDMPSFSFNQYKTFPIFRELLLGQFSNVEQADWVFCNTFDELETEFTEWMTKIFSTLRTIGPTIPSMYLGKQLQDDEDYGCTIFKSEECINWLNNKPKRSVIYVSFGSVAKVSEEQMEEMAWGLQDSDNYFLWVVRATEEEKLPKNFMKNSEKGLVVKWCPQLKALSHEVVGCFVTHCGWNSTLEALSLGVPMVAMPQWADQSTNAKHIVDIWKVGLRAKVDEKGIVKREVLKNCIRQVMVGEEGKEITKNSTKWKSLAARAVDEGGSSHKNITEFVNSLLHL